MLLSLQQVWKRLHASETPVNVISPHLYSADILPAPTHLPHLPTSFLSESDCYTPVIQEFQLQAEIPIDKAQMMQKRQAGKNVTFIWPAAQCF